MILKTPVSKLARLFCNLRSADDTTILATSEKGLQTLLNCVARVSAEFGLLMNVKTKIMVVSKNEIITNVFIGNHKVEQVSSYIYLGAELNSSNDCSKEIRRRTGIARGNSVKLANIWKDRNISNRTKICLIKCLVWSTASYGCETWTLKASDENKLKAFELCTFRWILRISCLERKTNLFVLDQLDTKPVLLKNFMRRKLRHFGHIERSDSIERNILKGKAEGTRSRGSQKIAWLDNIKRWTGFSAAVAAIKASDRDCWRRVVANAVEEYGT